MTIQALPRASGFNPGSEVWLVAPFAESTWTAKIDWYLNFQMSRSLERNPKELPVEITEIERLTELNLQKPKTGLKYPLLVSSLSLLPNKWVVVYPPDLSLSDLCAFAIQLNSNFGNASLRLFLPRRISQSDFALAWEKIGSNFDLALVSDQ